MLLASMHPERVLGLILFGVSPFIGGHGTEFPWTTNGDTQCPLLAPVPQRWGETWSLDRFAPSRADHLDFRDWWSRLLRAATSPSVIATVLANARAVDIRALLPSITSCTLVIHRIGDRLVPRAAGRFFAARMPHARLVELPGHAHLHQPDRRQPRRHLDRREGHRRVREHHGHRAPARSPAPRTSAPRRRRAR